MEKLTIIQGDFDTPLTSVGRLSIQAVNKAAEVLIDTVYLLNFIDIYQTLHPPKSRVRVLLKCTWNDLQDRLLARPLNKSQ